MPDNPDRSYAHINMLHWNEIFRDHAEDSPNLAKVLSGGLSLTAFEVDELGDVSGLNGLHLQCGAGLDTLSLARLGADMTGIDISSEACAAAEALSKKAGVQVNILQGDILDPTQLPRANYDFVYTSRGVLRWLPRLDEWATNVCNLLRPRGWMYIHEIHPLVYRLSAIHEEAFVLTGHYFEQTSRKKLIQTTHLGEASEMSNRTVIHTDWSLSAVVQALLGVGLRIDLFAEHSSCPYARKGLLPMRPDGYWGFDDPPMPLSFSIRASRPLDEIERPAHT
jgi:2-polyprenyl-3-methyl-5-hydroxy-6-metoxy-1,4-benzoquinol methylase